MSTIIKQFKLADRSVISACLLGARVSGTGLSGVRFGDIERPTKALAVAAAVAQAPAYVPALAANGAGEGRQKTQHHSMWAFRGLEPWRDPA